MAEAINNKRVAKNTAYLYVRMLLTMVVSLFTARIVFRELGADDYGVYTAIGGIIATMSFVTSVLASASQRFFSYEIGKGNEKSLETVFGTMLISFCIGALLIIMVAETLGSWFVMNKMNLIQTSDSTIMWIFQLSLASFIIALLTNPFQALIISNERMKLYAYVCILEVIIKLAIAFLLIVSPIEKLKFYSLMLFLSSLFINSIYVISAKKLYFRKGFHLSFDRAKFKEIFNYTSWTLFGSIASICNTQGLNIVLNLFVGPIANAAYSISSHVSGAVNGFAANFFVAVRPPLIKSYAMNDRQAMMRMFYFSSKIMFVLLFVIAFPISMITDFILNLWLCEVTEYMVPFVRLFLVYTLVLRLSDPISVLIQAANRVKIYHGIVDTFTLFSLPVAYYALRIGASAETVFAVSISVMIIAHALRLLIMRKYLSISISEYLSHTIVPIILTMFVCFSASLLIDHVLPHSTFFNLLTIGSAFVISVATSWFIMFSKNDRDNILKLFKR